jgi:mannose-6-phosphate isomerase-like protein (cupin superfamily)
MVQLNTPPSLAYTVDLSFFASSSNSIKMDSNTTLAQRILHTDTGKYRQLSGPHGGAGTMEFTSLLEADATDSNLIFLHRGVIHPGSGIGAHFHNRCEEMFVILDGEAQFTIDGRTALLKGPAGAPCLLGHSHAIYNPTNKPVQWLNVNVGLTKTYDSFDLGDSRADAPLDPRPTFMSMRLDRELLKEKNGASGGPLHRRVFQPSVFKTAWCYVDHYVLPKHTTGTVNQQQPDIGELYHVLAGSGKIQAASGDDQAKVSVQVGDAVPLRLGESVTIENDGDESLEFLVLGVARSLAAKEAFMAQ